MDICLVAWISRYLLGWWMDGQVDGTQIVELSGCSDGWIGVGIWERG